jgi:sugar phosphate isomerase/epimerase
MYFAFRLKTNVTTKDSSFYKVIVMAVYNIHKYMDLGIVHYVSFPEVMAGEGPIIETVEKIILDDFFTAIEITRMEDAETKKRVIDRLRYSGLKVVYSGGPPYAMQGINLSALEQAERESSLAKAKRLIDEAILFGASIHLLTGGPDPGPENRKEAKKRLIDSLMELYDYNNSQGNESVPVLSLEPVDRSVHRMGLIGPISEAVEVVAAVRAQGGAIWLTIDQSHLAQLGDTPEAAFSAASEFMIHLHLANCVLSDPSDPAYGDEHPRFGFPGGEHDLKDITYLWETLNKNNFFNQAFPYGSKPIISVEVKPQSDEEPEIVLAATKRAITKAWADISWKEHEIESQ